MLQAERQHLLISALSRSASLLLAGPLRAWARLDAAPGLQTTRSAQASRFRRRPSHMCCPRCHQLRASLRAGHISLITDQVLVGGGDNEGATNGFVDGRYNLRVITTGPQPNNSVCAVRCCSGCIVQLCDSQQAG